MKSVVAILLMLGCGCAQADVYKWTDEHGEVHFSETPPAGQAEKVMTQEQIQQIEQTDSARPQTPTENARSVDEEVEQRISECQRYKAMRQDLLLSQDRSAQQMTSMLIGRGYLLTNGNDGETNLTGYDEIEAGIRKYCLE